MATPVSNAASTSGSSQDTGEWHFLQCFGERTPGEDIQDGAPKHLDFSLDNSADIDKCNKMSR